MLMGCFWGVFVSQKSGSWVVGVLGAMAAGGLLGLVHAVLSIHLRANQVISGTAVNILGFGITSYGPNAIFGSGGSGDVPRIPSVMHFLRDVPLIGERHRRAQPHDLRRTRPRDRELVVHVPLDLGVAAARRRRASAGSGHGGNPGLPHPLLRRRPVRRPGRHGRCVSRLRARLAVQGARGAPPRAPRPGRGGPPKGGPPSAPPPRPPLSGFSQALGDALQAVPGRRAPPRRPAPPRVPPPRVGGRVPPLAPRAAARPRRTSRGPGGPRDRERGDRRVEGPRPHGRPVRPAAPAPA